MNFDLTLFKISKKQLLIKSVFVLISVALVALAIVLNKNANLGNDAVAVFYDGIRAFFNVDFGTATNIANLALFVFLLFFARKFINIGTFIYTFLLGAFVNIASKIIYSLNIPELLVFNIIKVAIGFLALFFGIALFISANIGVDVWTGLCLFLTEKMGKEYRTIKMCLDFSFVILGFLMGGKVGVITIIAALLGGPTIQMFTKITNKIVETATKQKGETRHEPAANSAHSG